MTSPQIRPRRMSDGRRTGEKVRRGSHLAGRCEQQIWRPFDPEWGRLIMRAAERYELETRPKGKKNGALGHVALEILREFLRLIDRGSGRLEPSIAYLMRRLKRSKQAITDALARLKEANFIGWIRRYEPTGETGFGVQVKQTSNAYWLCLPAIAKVARQLLGPVFGRLAPPPEDLAFETAQRAQQTKTYASEDSPLFALLGKFGDAVSKRDPTRQSQSALGSILEVANTGFAGRDSEKGHS